MTSDASATAAERAEGIGGGRNRTLKLACFRLADVKLARLKSCGTPESTRAEMSHLGSPGRSMTLFICRKPLHRPDSDTHSNLLMMLVLAVLRTGTMQVRTTYISYLTELPAPLK